MLRKKCIAANTARHGKKGKKNHLTFMNENAIIYKLLSGINDRGCKCRKAAGEESPGFIGQDAG